jgi:fluoroacetyl-CoA thioesterase
MRDTLKPGDRHTFRWTVGPEQTVPRLYPMSADFRAMPEVLATGFLVGLMEWACLDHLRTVVEDGEGSLGTAIDVTHTAPTPPGLTVTVEVEVEAIQGRRVAWRVVAHDGVDEIGRGRHERIVVRWERFAERVAAKLPLHR